jgi:hypothetical protein
VRAGSKAWHKIGHKWVGASVRMVQASAGTVEVLEEIGEAADSCRRARAAADVADSSGALQQKVFKG